MDWVITVPKTIKWEDYMKEVREAEEQGLLLNYHVRAIPKLMRPYDRMFVVWNGYIRGWMRIESTTYRSTPWTCLTTKTSWKPGWYIQRKGPWHEIDPIPMTGFRGVRKADWI